MPLVLRPAQSADWPELVDLWVASWSEVYDGVDFAPKRGWFMDHLVAWVDGGGECHIAFDRMSGAMAGFILVNPTDGHLDQFCVRRDLKGTGVAALMMAETRLLSPMGLHLDVNALNTRAIRFYEREGFERTGDGISKTTGQTILFYRWRA
jgi:putative acetyltransferase